ncbi:MAG: hypothetical protein ACXWC1_33665 [Burkholderiales bacterium]
MSTQNENKGIVGRWFTVLWGPDYNPEVIDGLAASYNSLSTRAQ